MIDKLTINPIVVFPIFIPWRIDNINLDDLENTLREILSLSGKIRFPNYEAEETSHVKIDLLEPDKSEIYNKYMRNKYDWRTDELYLLAFSQEITITDFTVQSYGSAKKLSLDEKKAFCKQVGAEEFASEVIYFLFLTHLAKPCHIQTDKGMLIYEDNYSKKIDRILYHFNSAIETAQKMNWPKIRSLEIIKVWTWAQEFDCGRDGFGYSPVGRGLCALSHLSQGEYWSIGSGAIDLFWALVGLEALYTRGSGELTQQLVDKTQVLLGKQKDFKKIVKNMYAFRSRFIHGDIAFPSYYFDSDAAPSLEKYSDETNEATNIATAILLVTLQELIWKGWHKLEFEYSLVGQT